MFTVHQTSFDGPVKKKIIVKAEMIFKINLNVVLFVYLVTVHILSSERERESETESVRKLFDKR